MGPPSKRKSGANSSEESSKSKSRKSEANGVRSNEGKQKPTKSKIRSPARSRVVTRSINTENTSVEIQEDGDVFAIKVDGQETDFQTDDEKDSNEISPENNVPVLNEQLEEGEIDSNNNATSVSNDIGKRQIIVETGREFDCDSGADTIPDEEEDEDELFKKWERSLKRRGLKVVSAERGEDSHKTQGYEDKGKRDTNSQEVLNNSESETTIYRPALEGSIHTDECKRLSSSSEEGNKISSGEEDAINDLINQFAGVDRMAKLDKERARERTRGRYVEDGERPHSSKDSRYKEHDRDRRFDDRRETERNIKSKANQLVRDAEKAKGRILDVPGNKDEFDKSIIYALLLDDDYKTVASHIDEQTITRITDGYYIDFARLISKDRIEEEEPRLLMVNREGQTYLGVNPEKDRSIINSLERWDCAFRVYSKIYLQHNPSRAAELVEYSHTIQAIANDYIWKDVYRYDREFRLHLERHPERNWGVILQKAWALYLRTRLSGSASNYDRNPNRYQDQQNKKRKICYRFNRGNCTYGFNCKFDHKCSFCYKTGHGSHICRRASVQEKERETGEVKHDYDNNRGRNDWSYYRKDKKY